MKKRRVGQSRPKNKKRYMQKGSGTYGYLHDPDHEESLKTEASRPGKMFGHGRRVAKKKKGLRVL